MRHEELEQRVLIIQCYLAHDSFTITGDARRPNGHHVLHVQLQKGSLHGETDMETVEGPGKRWYVMSIAQMQQLQPFCRNAGTSGRGGR
jgi:hypothetical protein